MMKPVWNTILIFLLFCQPAASQLPSGSSIPRAVEKDFEIYRQLKDFKAFAMSRAQEDGAEIWVSGHSHTYDTPKDAVTAALAFCRQSRERQKKPEWEECRIVYLGDTVISLQEKRNFGLLVQRYEERVIAALKEEIIRTGNRQALTMLETVYQKLGRYQESEALLLMPAAQGDPDAQNALAYHWAQLNHSLPLALELADRAIETDPNHFSYYDSKAMVLYRMGRYPEAIEQLEKSSSLSNNPIARDHLGDLYWLVGQKKKARQCWETAMEASTDILFIDRLGQKRVDGMTGDIVFE